MKHLSQLFPQLCTYSLIGIFSLGCLFTATTVEASAKKKASVSSVKKTKGKKKRSRKRRRTRHACNTTVGKQQAIDFIRSNEELAALADMEYDPTLHEQLASKLDIDGEILTDEDVEEDGGESIQGEEEEGRIDIVHFQEEWLSYMNKVEGGTDLYTLGGLEKKTIMTNILDWIGTRYHFGGMSRSGIDCSAFTQRIFANTANVLIPRTAASQHEVGESIATIDDLQFGDLIFFNTRRAVYVSHVGIYLGNSLFAHASSRYGVTVSSLKSAYYQKTFIGGKRLLMEHIASLSTGTEQSSLQRENTDH